MCAGFIIPSDSLFMTARGASIKYVRIEGGGGSPQKRTGAYRGRGSHQKRTYYFAFFFWIFLEKSNGYDFKMKKFV